MPPSQLKIQYSGRRGPMLWLALKTGLLVILTLGFYRFWAKTRLRRYFWSAIRPGGLPLEYVGDPLEKLLGFFVAVVFMAFYIGIVNLILMYFSFAFLNGNIAAYVASFAGLLPIIFFAQYRARRYILARTRWRGIRFGLEPGAWGYSWRAMVHWIVVILSLGTLLPLTSLWLEKYRVNRTYYGDHKFVQGGRRGLLFGAMKHVYYAVGLSAVAGGMTYLFDNPLWVFLFLLTVPWFIYGMAYWSAESFKRLTEAKTLGSVQFRTAPRAGRIIGIYSLGWLLINIVFTAALLILAGTFAAYFATAEFDPENIEQLETAIAANAPLLIIIYFLVFLGYRAMVHAWITLPLVAHFAEVTELVTTEEIHTIAQRERDEFVEAEGFADALDVGAAI